MKKEFSVGPTGGCFGHDVEDSSAVEESSADLATDETLRIDAPVDVKNCTTLAHKTLCIGEWVCIQTDVVCDQCEILIESKAQILVNKNGSLTLKNCTVKSAEDGAFWRFPYEYACLLEARGPLKMAGCLVEGIVIDALDQWAVATDAGHVEVYDTKFAGCKGNFFKVSHSGTTFSGENLTVENHRGKFLGNRIWSYDAISDDGRVFLKNCDFRFSPRTIASKCSLDICIEDGAFMEFTGRMADCTFTAENYPADWGGGCLSLRGRIEHCTFTICSQIVTDEVDFCNCTFEHCSVRNMNDNFEDEAEGEEP